MATLPGPRSKRAAMAFGQKTEVKDKRAPIESLQKPAQRIQRKNPLTIAYSIYFIDRLPNQGSGSCGRTKAASVGLGKSADRCEILPVSEAPRSHLLGVARHSVGSVSQNV